jgi:hypothetical protein
MFVFRTRSSASVFKLSAKRLYKHVQLNSSSIEHVTLLVIMFFYNLPLKIETYLNYNIF